MNQACNFFNGGPLTTGLKSYFFTIVLSISLYFINTVGYALVFFSFSITSKKNVLLNISPENSSLFYALFSSTII